MSDINTTGLKSRWKGCISSRGSGENLFLVSFSFWGLLAFLACGHLAPSCPHGHISYASSVCVKSPS